LASAPRLLLFSGHDLPPHLPPFPTRRSSDLSATSSMPARVRSCRPFSNPFSGICETGSCIPGSLRRSASAHCRRCCRGTRTSDRSEEHTSELQSRFDLVCRLLLEKKKNIHQQ